MALAVGMRMLRCCGFGGDGAGVRIRCRRDEMHSLWQVCERYIVCQAFPTSGRGVNSLKVRWPHDKAPSVASPSRAIMQQPGPGPSAGSGDPRRRDASPGGDGDVGSSADDDMEDSDSSSLSSLPSSSDDDGMEYDSDTSEDREFWSLVPVGLGGAGEGAGRPEGGGAVVEGGDGGAAAEAGEAGGPRGKPRPGGLAPAVLLPQPRAGPATRAT